MRFYIIERQACVVTWRFPVEAESELEAMKKYSDGDHGDAEGEPMIGDALDYIDFNLEVEHEEDKDNAH